MARLNATLPIATALLAGALVTVASMALGCSKQSSAPVAPVSQYQPASWTTTSVAPSSVPMGSGTPAVEPKKVVRKKPLTVAYKNPDYGVSFRYPRKYVLKNGNDARQDLAGLGPLSNNFVREGGLTVATLEIPADLYQGTDFESAFFNVSVNPNLSAEECSQFAAPVRTDTTLEPSKVDLGGLQFDEVEDPMKLSTARYYHVFENGACYEFALGLGTSGEQQEGVVPVNREVVFGKLQKILASVKIQPSSEPAVATKTTSSPAPDMSNR